MSVFSPLGRSGHLVALCAACLFSVSVVFWPAGAESGDLMPLWKRVGGWDIRVDMTLGYGCFVMAEYKSGTVFRTGFDITNGKGYIIVGNKEWASLEEGKEYPLSLKFGNEPAWSGDAIGFQFNNTGGVYLYIVFSNLDLLEEFMRKTSVEIRYQENLIATLSLKGSYSAFMEAIRCQKTMADRMPNSPVENDPFARRVRPSSDPFAN